jgi:hypothetical protein
VGEKNLYSYFSVAFAIMCSQALKTQKTSNLWTTASLSWHFSLM